MIQSRFKHLQNPTECFLSKDNNGREINLYHLKDVQFLQGKTYYPGSLVFSHFDKQAYFPLKERVMSLQNLEERKTDSINLSVIQQTIQTSVFFFVVNTDNYFHFLYDSLPYLISYRKLKEKCKDLKLLMNFSIPERTEHYKFVVEFLELLGIYSDEILIASENVLYKDMYFTNSYTHDIDSNLPPRNEIYNLYSELVKKAKDNKQTYPKNIYISRRTWLHNNMSNIGTNYTTRRKMTNEDGLVKLLRKKDYVEIFTENLSTIEKINMFFKCENVVAAIGGGVCNVLFSPEQTKLFCIVSPTFLEVNSRFRYTLEKTNVTYVNDTSHVEQGKFKKHMRVSMGKIVGEIEEIYDDSLLISYTDKVVSGWNSEMNLKRVVVKKNDCVALDSGLNSPYYVDLKKVEQLL